MTVSRHIRFCTAPKGVRIAYGIAGKGAPIVRAAHWLTHIEFDGVSPVWRHWFAELTRQNTLVRYDARGCGLSDRDVDDLSFDAWVGDLEAVVDSAGIKRFALLGISRGGPVAIAYAARHPERVSHLILYATRTTGVSVLPRSRQEMDEHEMQIRLAEIGWDRDNPSARQMFATLLQPDGTSEQHRSFGEIMRLATSGRVAAKLLRVAGQMDVRTLAPLVACPTLVLHARDDARVPFEEGRLTSSLIPGSRFVPLSGRNHILVENEPAWAQFVSELRGFLSEPASPSVPPACFVDLSPREVEILEMIAAGLANRLIAARLRLSDKTVRNHINRIFRKLDVQSRAQAIVMARDAGLGRTTAASSVRSGVPKQA